MNRVIQDASNFADAIASRQGAGLDRWNGARPARVAPGRTLDEPSIPDRLSDAGRELGLSNADIRLLADLHGEQPDGGLFHFAGALALANFRPAEPLDLDDPAVRAEVDATDEPLFRETFRLYARLLLFTDRYPTWPFPGFAFSA